MRWRRGGFNGDEFDGVCLRVWRRLGEDSGDSKAMQLPILCTETKSTSRSTVDTLVGLGELTVRAGAEPWRRRRSVVDGVRERERVRASLGGNGRAARPGAAWRD